MPSKYYVYAPAEDPDERILADPYLSVNQIARALGVNSVRARELVAEWRVPFIRAGRGGAIKVRRSVFERAARRNETTEHAPSNHHA
jgi:hypothetical protein